MNISILRLKTGDDIIGIIQKENNKYHINSPMIIWVDNDKGSKLIMDHWLPVEIIKENIITLKEEDILTEFLPNEQLREYYLHIVNQYNSVLQSNEYYNQMDDEELEDIKLALQEVSGAIFH